MVEFGDKPKSPELSESNVVIGIEAGVQTVKQLADKKAKNLSGAVIVGVFGRPNSGKSYCLSKFANQYGNKLNDRGLIPVTQVGPASMPEQWKRALQSDYILIHNAALTLTRKEVEKLGHTIDINVYI